jgi:hypothetical protein
MQFHYMRNKNTFKLPNQVPLECFSILFFFFFFLVLLCELELTLARQVLYHLSPSASLQYHIFKISNHVFFISTCYRCIHLFISSLKGKEKPLGICTERIK